MKNDELLKQQSQLLVQIAEYGGDLCHALSQRDPDRASRTLSFIFSTVDAMRASAKPATVYIPAMGEGVLVEGIIEEVDEGAGMVKVRFNEGALDYLWIAPMQTPVMPL